MPTIFLGTSARSLISKPSPWQALRSEFFAELAFYRKYHRHRQNWWIHYVCVPLEVTTFLVPAACVHRALPLLVSAPTALYGALLDPPRTLLPAAITCSLGIVAERVVAVSGGSTGRALLLALALHAAAWIMQVPVGHWMLEKNTPAMQDKMTLNSVVLCVLLATYV